VYGREVAVVWVCGVRLACCVLDGCGGGGTKSTFEKTLSTVVHRLGNHLSQPKSCVPIVKIGFLILAGGRAKVRENVNEKSV